METCEVCGKVSADVAFDPSRGKHLCISCKFGTGEFRTRRVQKPAAQQAQPARANPAIPDNGQNTPLHDNPEQQNVQWRREQRKPVTIPVLVSLDLMVGGVKSQIFYPASIQNFSRGGICIDWSHCDECTGYKEGDVHPFCIFSQFNVRNAEAKELTIRVEIANLENQIEFRGKVVYTLKKGDKEYIGINFSHIEPDTLDQLERLCRNL
jgi:hypothetical protein